MGPALIDHPGIAENLTQTAIANLPRVLSSRERKATPTIEQKTQMRHTRPQLSLHRTLKISAIALYLVSTAAKGPF